MSRPNPSSPPLDMICSSPPESSSPPFDMICSPLPESSSPPLDMICSPPESSLKRLNPTSPPPPATPSPAKKSRPKTPEKDTGISGPKSPEKDDSGISGPNNPEKGETLISTFIYAPDYSEENDRLMYGPNLEKFNAWRRRPRKSLKDYICEFPGLYDRLKEGLKDDNVSDDDIAKLAIAHKHRTADCWKDMPDTGLPTINCPRPYCPETLPEGYTWASYNLGSGSQDYACLILCAHCEKRGLHKSDECPDKDSEMVRNRVAALKAKNLL